MKFMLFSVFVAITTSPVIVAVSVVVAEDRPLTVGIRVLACLIGAMCGGLVTSVKRSMTTKNVIVSGVIAGIIGAAIGLFSHHYAKDSETGCYTAIGVALIVGLSGPQGYAKVLSTFEAFLFNWAKRRMEDDGK